MRFNKTGWTSMLVPALRKYDSTKHSSTTMTPNQVHKDENNTSIRIYLKLRETNRRKYPQIKEGDSVKYFREKKGDVGDDHEATGQ